jgi:aromatic ring-opening dioxygenase catalytic subunit (LigB family)
MAELVCTMALAHAPGMTGWFEKAEPGQRERLTAGYAELARRLRAAKPDVILGFGNDHLLNLPFDNPPDLCIGTAAEWRGPAPWFEDWLAIEPFRVAGRPDVAEALVTAMDRRGVSMAFRSDLLMDDNFSVPLKVLTPQFDIPLVPVHMNCLVPPVATPQACFEVGKTLASAIREDLPAGLRVALMSTGGLSHDPGGPRYFEIDEAFDRWFLSLLETGATERAFAECTLERMREAGAGGTPELIAWFIAWGAAQGAAAEIVCYEPTVGLRCSMGGVAWN